VFYVVFSATSSVVQIKFIYKLFELSVGSRRMLSGSEFQNDGPQMENWRSLNVLSLCVNRRILSDRQRSNVNTV